MKWKQKLGSSATYSNLIGLFERAGYQNYADTVRNIHGKFLVKRSSCEVDNGPSQQHLANSLCMEEEVTHKHCHRNVLQLVPHCQ